MDNRKIIYILVFFVLMLVLLVCTGEIFYGDKNSGDGQGNKLRVTASFYPLYYFASVIGGDRVEITDLTPAGVEPHDYEPSPQDIAHMEKSHLVIISGTGLEPWSANVRQNLSGGTVLVLAGEGLQENTYKDGDEAVDPHIWLSPVLAEKMVDKIAAGFKQADPANGAYYQENVNGLKGRLKSLNEKYKTDLADCSRHDIITSHAAFGYLASAYGLKQVSIAGLSPDAEPSARELAGIAKFAQENNAKYIFFESLASPKLSQTIANEVGAQTLVLDPLEGLSNEDIAQGKDYFTQMDKNLENLRLALGCK